MASLKEIKGRIASVRTTRKITAAMKMVAAAKLHRAQRAIGALVPYAENLEKIVEHLVAYDKSVTTPFAEVRDPQRAAVVAFASNGTLCGVYNHNVLRRTEQAVAELRESTTSGCEIRVLAVGKQLAQGLGSSGLGVDVDGNYEEFSDKPTYARSAAVAKMLMDEFLSGRLDRVEVVYYKFHSAGRQELVCETLLPITIEHTAGEEDVPLDYILEPSRKELVEMIVPRSVIQTFYASALSAAASEHAARMVAMQSATDNADQLVDELSVEYNKQRQQAITAELLDIMGGQSGR